MGRKFKLTIELGNDEMKDGRDLNIALRKVGEFLVPILEGGLPGRTEAILDANGNKVGRWSITR